MNLWIGVWAISLVCEITDAALRVVLRRAVFAKLMSARRIYLSLILLPIGVTWVEFDPST